MVRRGLIVVCALFAACSFDPGSFTSQGGADGAPLPDAPGSIDGRADAGTNRADAMSIPDAAVPDARPPDAAPPLGPFDPPVLVGGINLTSDEDDPTLRGDMLEMYFNSDRTGGLGLGDIWRTTRASISDPWGPPENVANLNTAYNETTPKMTADGLTIYVASDRPGTIGGTDIYRATRLTPTAAFGTLVRVSELCSDAYDYSAQEQPGGLTLYMGSTRTGGAGGLDVYRALRLSPLSAWGIPSLLGEIDTTDVESDAWVDATDMVMYFDGDRPGTLGGRDLWICTRSALGSPFGAITDLTELNSAYDDMDPWLSPDQRTIYFSTTRLGDEDIYMSTR